MKKSQGYPVLHRSDFDRDTFYLSGIKTDSSNATTSQMQGGTALELCTKHVKAHYFSEPTPSSSPFMLWHCLTATGWVLDVMDIAEPCAPSSSGFTVLTHLSPMIFNQSRRMLRPKFLIKSGKQIERLGKERIIWVCRLPRPVRQPQGVSLCVQTLK